MLHSALSAQVGAATLPYRPRVLVMHDNPEARAGMLHELQDAFPSGRILPVCDLKTWDDHLNGEPLDLVITDYRLTWTNGLAVLIAVKTRRPECLVMMFTEFGSEEIAVRAMKSGLDDYVVKRQGQYGQMVGVARTLLSNRPWEPSGAVLVPDPGWTLHRAHGAIPEAPQPLLTERAANSESPADGPHPHGALAEWVESIVQSPECTRLLSRALETGQAQVQDVEWNDAAGAAVRLRIEWAPSQSRDGEAIDPAGQDHPQPSGDIDDATGERQSSGARLMLLSPRERQVTEHVVSGKTNKYIARQLGISPRTVEMHRANIRKKLRVRSVAELVRVAVGMPTAELPLPCPPIAPSTVAEGSPPPGGNAS